MEIETFKSILSECKGYAPCCTGANGLKVKGSGDRIIQKIVDDKGRGLIVEFEAPHHLTIFEAEMLYDLIHKGKKPGDYASFHKCKAGEKFIKNIVGLTHLKPKIIIEEDVIYRR